MVSAHEELARLGDAIREADDRLTETGRRATERLAPLPELQAAEGRAWAAGDEQEAERARKRRAALEQEAETWRLRLRACEGALEQAEQQRKAFIEGNGDRLIDEERDEAARDVERLDAMAHGFLDAYAAVMRRQGELNRFSGDHRRHRRDDPTWTAAAAAVDRALAAGVPDPVPAPAMVAEEVA